jgi:microcystin-dependent protein
MWSGTIATIPSGWLLCDGSNSTPDLRSRFIIGANADDGGAAKTNVTGSATQTGGTKDAIVVSHTHTATVTDPGHTHPVDTNNNNDSGTGTISAGNTAGVTTANRPLAKQAFTSISVANSTEGSSGTNANLVPYYALAFIMKS